MSKLTQSRTTRRSKYLYGSVGTVPIVAMLVATQPAQAVLLSNASNTVSLCSGVQLPRSDITSALLTPLTQIVSPLEATTNGLLSNVNSLVTAPLLSTLGLSGATTTPINTDVAGILNQAATGGNFSLTALTTGGTLLAPGTACYAQASGLSLANPTGGIAVGGNAISGLGDPGQNIATAGDTNAIAFGNNASTPTAATGAIAIGTNATVGNTVPASIDSIAIGRAATVNGANSVALGTTTTVTGANAVAVGNAATVGAANSTALGNAANVSVANSVALGAQSTATRGANASYSATGVGAGQSSAGEVSVGTSTATRQITNVAPGSMPTDAVNVAQLNGIANTVTTLGTNVANGAIGTVRYSNSGAATVPNGGTVTNDLTLVGSSGAVGLHNVAAGTAPTDAVNFGQLSATNTNVTNLGTALTTSINTTNTNIANGSVGLLRYSSSANPTVASGVPSNDVTLIGANATNPVGIHNVAAGTMATDAVNLGQLNTVSNTLSNSVSTVAGNVATLSGLAVQYNGTNHQAITLGGAGGTSLTNLAAGNLSANSTDAVNGSQLNSTNSSLATLGSNVSNGAIGVVRYSNNATPTLANGGTVTNDVTLVGTGGTVGIHNVTAGTAATDAANVGQLTALGNLAVQYSGTDHNTVALAGTNGTRLSNLAAGALSTTSTDAVNGSQLNATNTNVTNLTNGSLGIVRYSSAGNPTVANGGTASNDVTLVGTGGAVGIHNVAAGSATTDAVNVGQLAGVSTSLNSTINTTNLNLASLAGLAVKYTGTDQATITLGGPNGTTIGNVAAGVAATDAANVGQVNTVANSVTNLASTTSTAITNLTNSVSNGGIGVLQYSDAANPTVANGGHATNDVTLVGTGGAVGIHNVAAGSATTDAVNVGQLTNVSTSLNSTINTTNLNLASLAGLAVKYTGTDQAAITLGGPNGTTIGNVAAGVAATDAANVGQVNTVANSVTNLANNTTTSVNNLTNAVIRGAIGVVQYSDATTPTVANGGTVSGDVTLVGTGGTVGIHNVTAGTLSAASTDAVNGAQLFATNTRVDANTTGLASLGTTVVGQGTQIATNTTDIGALTTTVGANTTLLQQQGSEITVNAGAIQTLRQDTSNGAIGTVQYSNPLSPTVPNGGTPTNDVALVGRDPGVVALHNVANGVVAAGSTDGVNGGQLFALGDQVGTLSNLAVEYDTASKSSVTLGNGTDPVALRNIQAGTLGASSTDAVNGAQLFATNSNVATNAGNITALQGNVADNTSTINTLSTTVGTQGAQISNNTSAIGTLSALSVQYNDTGHGAITLGGAGAPPVALGNVQAGSLSATSTDAVNGSQLFATNTNVAANADAIGTLRTETANGAIGPVQYSFAATPTTPNGGTPTNDLALVGAAAGPVGLHNVANGAVTQGSTDAVNGSQLFALSTSVGSLSGLAVQYDDSSRTRITLSNPAGTPVSLSGIGAGTLSAASSDAVNGAQLFETNRSVAALSTTVDSQSTQLSSLNTQVSDNSTTISLNRAELASLQTNVSNGAIGTVQYSSADQPTTSNGGVPSQDLTLVGANSGAVALHNVAAGSVSATSTDAVNGAQLFATNQSVSSLATSVDNATSAITSLNGTVATNTADIAQTSANLSQLDTAVTNGAIGPVQYSSATSPTTSNGGVPSQDLTLVGAASGAVALHNLAAGSLAIGSTDAVNGGQLGALGMATASVFGGNYTYNPATNSYSGSFSYGGTDYSNLQAVLGAIQISVGADGNPETDTGIKYFHTTSTMADSSATGANSTAIGPNSASSGDSSIAVGLGATASGSSSVAIGESASAQNGEAVSIGSGNMASGNGAVSIGDPNIATGEGAIALGKDNTATGNGAIALGNTNSATGLGAASIGYINTSSGDGATTIGASNAATGIGAIAIGSNNVVTGDHSLAIGTDVQTTADDTLAIGSHAASSGTSSVTIGNRTVASGTSAAAVGNDTLATAAYTAAFGNEAAATGSYSLADGAMSKATSFASTAIGAGASVTGFGSTAVGTGSIASYDGSVALGSASETVRGAVAAYSAFGLSGDQASAGEIAIARNIVYTDPTTGLPTLTGARQITGVAAGSADTDAVNVAQLRGASASVGTIVAAALGGGSSYDAATGQLTAPSYTFGNVTYANVGAALQALAATGTGSGTSPTGTGTGGGTTANPTVTYADASQSAVTLAPSGTTIQNVAPGALTATSTDAVNGSQLAATNAAVATNSGAISTLATQVSNGAVGVLRYSSSSAPTVANGGTQSNDATLVGADTSAPVALHNVAAGSVAVGSTDAVNGGQLAATNAAVVTAQTTANTALTMSSNSLQYDSPAESSVTLGNSSSGAVTVHNVAPGITATDAANVGQVSAAMSSAVSQANGYTDGRIAQLSFDLKNVQRDAAAGAAGAMALAGMPQPYEAGKGMISMGAGTFQGQTAIAMGVAKALGDGHTVIKLGATYNSRGMVGANGGLGWQF